VNQQWDGDSGRLVAQSESLVRLPNCGSGSPCDVPTWMVLSKALPPTPHNDASVAAPSSRAAVFLLNNNNRAMNVSVTLAAVPGLGSCESNGCSVRSIWHKLDLPAVHTQLSAVLVSDSMPPSI
jgi:hypothetical protein